VPRHDIDQSFSISLDIGTAPISFCTAGCPTTHHAQLSDVSISLHRSAGGHTFTNTIHRLEFCDCRELRPGLSSIASDQLLHVTAIFGSSSLDEHSVNVLKLDL
jgi:hypothetical protein